MLTTDLESHLDSGVALTPEALSTRERIVDLIALLCLLGVATTVYVIAGPNACVVTGVGLGLFASWKANRST